MFADYVRFSTDDKISLRETVSKTTDRKVASMNSLVSVLGRAKSDFAPLVSSKSGNSITVLNLTQVHELKRLRRVENNI